MLWVLVALVVGLGVSLPLVGFGSGHGFVGEGGRLLRDLNLRALVPS